MTMTIVFAILDEGKSSRYSYAEFNPHNFDKLHLSKYFNFDNDKINMKRKIKENNKQQKRKTTLNKR